MYFLFVAARHPCRLLMWYRSRPAQYKAAARNKSQAVSDKHRAMKSSQVFFLFYYYLNFNLLKTSDKGKVKV